jgi:hypothetical protein
MDEIYNTSVETTERERQRIHCKKPPSLYKSKSYPQEGKVPRVNCAHDNGKQGCYALSLLDADIQHFFNAVYKQGGKTAQDQFLIKFMSVGDPKHNRKRRDDSVRSRPVQAEYFIHKKNGEQVEFCAKSFQSITCTSKDRLIRIARSFKTHSAVPI